MSGVNVTVRGVRKTYALGSERIEVLRGVDVDLRAGERVAVVGPSGSGKSTLMHLLALLDAADEGSIVLDDEVVTALSEAARDRIRNRRVGMIFQSHHLLPEHDALANVSVPVRLAGGTPAQAEARARALLTAVGLGHRLRHRPAELSGGERQRVAIARALVMGPGLVLADEPTGNLDPETAGGVFDLLLRLQEQIGTTLVVVTHSEALAARFPRVLRMGEGRLHEDAA